MQQSNKPIKIELITLIRLFSKKTLSKSDCIILSKIYPLQNIALKPDLIFTTSAN